MTRLRGFLTVLMVAFSVAWLVPTSAPAAGLGQFCGGIAAIKCDRGLFCERAAGTCRFPDFGGTCQRVPRICPRIFRPVCGCNGKTYANDCVRQAARVSKAHDGRCP